MDLSALALGISLGLGCWVAIALVGVIKRAMDSV
jgi:hypothetical protein